MPSRTSFFLLFLFLSLPLASAIKITGRNRIEFEPGKTVNDAVCIAPGDTEIIRLSKEGSIGQYISINHTVLNVTGDRTCVPYTVSLPDGFDTPGLQKGGITATEAVSRDGGVMGTRVRITHQIWIDVPYPGRYLRSSLGAKNTEAGEMVKLSASLTNKGNQTVTDANGVITIHEDDDTLDRVPLNVDDIASQEEVSLTAWWNSSDYDVGRYRAELTVDYAGNRTTRASNGFKLGTEELRLLNTTPTVMNDGIVPYTVRVESFWSAPLEAEASVDIEREQGGPVNFETKAVSVDAWETTKLVGYLDTAELETGTYDATVTVTYANTTDTYDREVTVQEPGSDGGSVNIYLYATIFLSILVLLLAAYVLRRD